jgi:hypothetical protein
VAAARETGGSSDPDNADAYTKTTDESARSLADD